MARKKIITAIPLSESAYQIWYDQLTEFFHAKGEPSSDIADKVKSILEESQKGWPHAPRDINVRIKMKSGFQWKSHNNLRSNTDSIPNVENRNRKIKETMEELYTWENHLTKSETTWWEKRKREYEQEFEFNGSSDQPLLFQVLLEELTQKRIAALMIAKPQQADSHSKVMTESLKRLHDTQTKLGITREQRVDEITSKGGDVASLSTDLDEKIRRAKFQIEEWNKEAERAKFRKSQDVPINVLPPVAKIESLLGIDDKGNLGKNLDTSEISDVLSKAAKIHDETLEDVSIEKAPKIKPHEQNNG